MRYITFIAVLLVSGLTACAGAAKKSQVAANTPYRFGYNPTSVDDLNLVVSSVERTPVGEVLIPKFFGWQMPNGIRAAWSWWVTA